MSIEPRQGQAFWRAKLLRPGGTSSDAALVVGGRTREPPHFFLPRFRKNGYPSLAADYTLALSSLMAAVVELHEKRPALPEKLKELQTKGRIINSNIKKTMAKFRVRTEYIFSGFFDIEAENAAQAREYVEKHCGLVIGSDIHSSLPDDEVNWEFPVHPDTKIGETTRIKP